jgi:hypothetical protein
MELLEQLLGLMPDDSDVGALFTLQIIRGNDFSGIPDCTAVGNWLAKNQTSFFAEPYRQAVVVKRKVLKNPLTALSIGSIFHLNPDDYREIEETEMRVKGFRPTVDMPFLDLVVQAIPQFPNLSACDCFVVPILSRTDLRLFYSYCRYRDVGWAKQKREGGAEWATLSCPIKDHSALKAIVENIRTAFWQFMLDPINNQFGIGQKKDETTTVTSTTTTSTTGKSLTASGTTTTTSPAE